MFGPGILGGMFDFNKDGELDMFESAAECQFLHEMMSEDEENDKYDENDNFDDDFSDDEH